METNKRYKLITIMIKKNISASKNSSWRDKQMRVTIKNSAPVKIQAEKPMKTYDQLSRTSTDILSQNMCFKRSRISHFIDGIRRLLSSDRTYGF